MKERHSDFIIGAHEGLMHILSLRRDTDTRHYNAFREWAVVVIEATGPKDRPKRKTTTTTATKKRARCSKQRKREENKWLKEIIIKEREERGCGLWFVVYRCQVQVKVKSLISTHTNTK